MEIWGKNKRKNRFKEADIISWTKEKDKVN